MINQNLLLTGDDAYNLTKSLRLRSSASAYLSRTPASAGNRNVWTISFWFKRGKLGSSQAYYTAGTGANVDSITVASSDKITIDLNNTTILLTSQVFRDPSAWYHLVFAVDTSQATASNRAKLYINGSLVTAFDTDNRSSITNNLPVTNTTVLHKYGYYDAGILYSDVYYAEVNGVDGQQLPATSFGSTNALTGVWQPAQYTGTYGTDGYYLPFTDVATTSGSNAGLGKDFSGNGNYWNTNNISVTAGTTYDSMNDVPTLTSATQANYCVLNPLDKNTNTALTNGNLDIASATSGTAVWYPASSTIKIPTSGKWYCEMIVGSADTAGYYRQYFGIITDTFPITTTTGIGNSTQGWAYFPDTGAVNNNGASIASLTASVTNDVIGIAFDSDAGTLRFYKNGVAMGASALTGFTSSYFFAASVYAAATAYVNFGQRPFSYTPPTGFVALNTFNLPEPSIKQGNKHFDAVTYTGNSSGASVTGVGFQPDFVWMKSRGAARNHELLNSVTGGSSTLFSNLTNAEATDQRISSFGSDGFTYTTNSNSANTGEAFVAWNWKANGAGSSNTAGSITSTVSANPTAGFSVVTYTGNNTLSTIGHGLGASPKFIIVKTRSGNDNWVCYHGSLGVQYYTLLNTTASSYNNLSDYWSATAPSSSVFGINAYGGVNTNGATYVAYCFAEVAGYSKFGSYTGNGSTDGTFVHLGFRPKFFLLKCSSNTNSWWIYDSSRSVSNLTYYTLQPDGSGAEEQATIYGIDLLSNGVKIRSSDTRQNGNGYTYIYMAFAEHSTKYALGR